jgi:hypothetical protein
MSRPATIEYIRGRSIHYLEISLLAGNQRCVCSKTLHELCCPFVPLVLCFTNACVIAFAVLYIDTLADQNVACTALVAALVLRKLFSLGYIELSLVSSLLQILSQQQP